MERALDNYEFAVVEEPRNGLLWDRYAYLLFKMGRMDDALAKADEAVCQAADEAEPHFTRGLILARLGRAMEARDSLENAAQRGKSRHLCLLQMAHGFIREGPHYYGLVRNLLDESEDLARDLKGRLVDKHRSEIRLLRDRIYRGRRR
jgi:tetratricopeptide (TPR) repeat protein